MSGNVLFLHRPEVLDEGELDAVRAVGWRTTTSVLDVSAGDLVIARHYAWPWPKQLDRDVAECGGVLLNNARAYAYAASPLSWSADLGDLTPATWEDFSRLPEGGEYILKGAKADKGRWSRMYARGRAAAIALRSELQCDSGMRAETIVAREYVPLRVIGDGMGGCPIADEHRVFVLDGEVVARGAYWPAEDCTTPPTPSAEIPAAFLRDAVSRVNGCLRWYALDVARAAAGGWIVIEVNDGQRSGLSGVPALELYRAMAERLRAVPTAPHRLTSPH